MDSRYENATSDLLWRYKSDINPTETEINHMNFSLIHTFMTVPSTNESQQIQLFTYCGYELTLIDKQPISSTVIDELLDELYDNQTEIEIKNYTFEEWKGIRQGDYIQESERYSEIKTRRRLNKLDKIVEGVINFCKKYEKFTRFWGHGGEIHLGFWAFELYVSQIKTAIQEDKSFLELLISVSGMDKFNIEGVDRKPLRLGPFELDFGIKFAVGIGWDWEKKKK